MNNPWLTIPLEDHESHMALPDVGKPKCCLNEFRELLKAYVPASVAVVGCAGSNGLDEAVEAGVTRLIGVDINPIYIEDAKTRYAGRMDGLELYRANIEETLLILLQVQMVYAALVFEYVNLTEALNNLRGLCLAERGRGGFPP